MSTFFFSVLLCGCASQGALGPLPGATTVSESSQSASQTVPKGTAVAGFLGQSGLSQQPAPDALPGYSVVARDSTGKVLATSTTGPNGAFQLEGLQPGLVYLEFSATPGSPPSLSVPVTAVAGVPIFPALPTAVGRLQAFGMIGAPAGSLVLGSLNPLPARTTLGDEKAPARYTIGQPSWFFFIDPLADTYFEHPVELVLVDSNTGAVTRLPIESWPYVNGWCTWTDPDLDSPSKSPEVIQGVLPKISAAATLTTQGLLPKVGEGNGQVFAVLIAGYEEPGILTASARFEDWLRQQGVPQSQIFRADVAKKPQKEAAANCEAAFLQARRPMLALERQGKAATLIVQINSHGGGRTDPGAPGGLSPVFLSERENPSASNTTFGLSFVRDRLEASGAARVIFFGDFCSSGAYAEEMHKQLKKTREYALFSGAKDHEFVSDEVYGLPREKMMWFTRHFTERGRLIDGEVKFLTELVAGTEVMVFQLSEFISGNGNKQHPQIFSSSVPQPVLDGFQPTQGDAGTSVTLQARNLGHGYQVFFSQDRQAVVESTTPEDLTGNVTLSVRVPSGAVSGSIRILNPNGKQTVNNSIFQVTSPYDFFTVYGVNITKNVLQTLPCRPGPGPGPIEFPNAAVLARNDDAFFYLNTANNSLGSTINRATGVFTLKHNLLRLTGNLGPEGDFNGLGSEVVEAGDVSFEPACWGQAAQIQETWTPLPRVNYDAQLSLDFQQRCPADSGPEAVRAVVTKENQTLTITTPFALANNVPTPGLGGNIYKAVGQIASQSFTCIGVRGSNTLTLSGTLAKDGSAFGSFTIQHSDCASSGAFQLIPSAYTLLKL